MEGAKIETTITGGQNQGVIGARTVIIENFNMYSRAIEEVVGTDDTDEPIGTCPYPGLSYFGPDDADLFFGRGAAIARLAQAVGRDSLTALAGASGSGKSSVVLAGLAPRLNRTGKWRFSHFRIGTELEKNPFLAMARALVPLYVASTSDTERLRNTKELAASLQAGELTLLDVFADCRNRDKGARILLIADQFEEAFTLVEDEADLHHFINVLLAGFPDPPPGSRPDVCLILTLRADFYGRALRHRPLADALQGHVENLGPMNREELQAAIRCPAENCKVSFDPGLVETLLDDVESKPGGLPLLQFALREMWGRQERRRITRKSYDETGGIERALAQRAETIFATMAKTGTSKQIEQDFRRLFTRLVTLGEGQEDTRRVVDRQELGDTAWSLAQRLAGEDNRLVVTNAPAFSHETAEVAHEALIRHWPRLIGWIDRDRAFQSWLRQIRSNIELWSADPSDDGPLLRGGMLAQAREWLSRRRDDLSRPELAFLEASLHLQQRIEEEREASAQAELKRQRDLTDAALSLAYEQRKRGKYVWLFFGLIAVLLLINNGFDFWFSYQENKIALVRVQQEKAESVAQRIAEFVEEIKSQIGWTTHMRWAEGPLDRRRQDYIQLLSRVPAIAEVAQLDGAGKEQLKVSGLAMDVVGSEADFSQSPAFTEAKAHRTWFSPVYFRKESEPYMTLAIARDGRNAGVTIAEINLKLIWDIITSLKIGQGGYAFAVDGRGRLISHPDISLVLRDTDLSKLPQVATALAPQPGQPAVTTADNLAGRSVLTAHAAIPQLGWRVFVEVPLSEAFAPLYGAALRTGVLLAFGLILSGLIALAMTRRLSPKRMRLKATLPQSSQKLLKRSGDSSV
jgi:hypothetical protein